jgi:hypothetical protein
MSGAQNRGVARILEAALEHRGAEQVMDPVVPDRAGAALLGLLHALLPA